MGRSTHQRALVESVMAAETTSRLKQEVVTTPVTKFATLICAQSAVAAPTDIN